MRKVGFGTGALAVTAILACFQPERDASAIFISDVADTSLEVISAKQNRSAELERARDIANADLHAQLNSAFASEARCHGISIVASGAVHRRVPAHYLHVYFWHGNDGTATPEWQWSMNGAKLAGKATSVRRLVQDVCSAVKQSGASLDSRL
jgi:hypothetical protein